MSFPIFLFTFTQRSLLVQDKGKKEFFKLVVLSIVMNQPPFMLQRLYEKDWREMFRRAERDHIAFNHYFEWVTNDINKCVYSYDDFIDMDREHRRQSERILPSAKSKPLLVDCRGLRGDLDNKDSVETPGF